MWQMFIQSRHGDIILNQYYDKKDEMYRDVEVLMKPSMFGTPEFRFVMQKVEPNHQ